LLASGLVAGSYAYQRGQASQAARLTRISALATKITSSNEQRAEANADTERRIAHIVCLNHNWRPDLAVLTQAQQIRAHTQALIDTMNLLRQQLRSAATSPRMANSLLAQLDRYAAFIGHYAPEAAPCAGLSPKAANDWGEQVAMGELPVPAALATLSELDAWLLRCEAQALQKQAEKVGNKGFYFDRIGPLAVPSTETITPGGTYRAQLFLAQSGHSDFCNMEMTANGKPLTLPSKPGMQVQFAVPTWQPGQPDTVRAYWHGTIRGPFFPRDTVLRLAMPYLIVQPRTL